jgi:hypothetical protein
MIVSRTLTSAPYAAQNGTPAEEPQMSSYRDPLSPRLRRMSDGSVLLLVAVVASSLGLALGLIA